MESLCHESLHLSAATGALNKVIAVRSSFLFIRIVFLLNLASIGSQEDLLERCHRNSVALDSELIHARVKLFEELSEVGCLLVADLKGDLLRGFSKFLDFAKVGFQVRLDLSVGETVFLDHGQFVTSSISVL